MQRIGAWFRSDRGQSLADYTLILALVCLIGLGVLIKVSGGIEGIWAAADKTVAAGAQAAAPAPASTGATPADPATRPGGRDGDHNGR